MSSWRPIAESLVRNSAPLAVAASAVRVELVAERPTAVLVERRLAVVAAACSYAI